MPRIARTAASAITLRIGPDFPGKRRICAPAKRRFAGVDEAGRGPLAGPVVAAAVVLDPQRVPEGLGDSKQIAPDERARLYEIIVSTADVAVASVSARSIDATDIRKATLEAMRRAVAGLRRAPARISRRWARPAGLSDAGGGHRQG